MLRNDIIRRSVFYFKKRKYILQVHVTYAKPTLPNSPPLPHATLP